MSIRLRSAKASCKTRNVTFDKNLTKEILLDIYNKQDGLCKLSGRKMTHASNKDINDMNTISIDRIDSSKGYTESNIQLVCWAVNQMKNDLSNEEIIDWCKDIVNNTI